MTIHWVGTGLSSIPGLRRLLGGKTPVTVWNRTVEKAEVAVGELTDDIREFSSERLAAEVRPGDVVVSMLPADRHPALARMCVERRAHFVSPSYISPEMAALEQAAMDAGVALVNEVGLDPGIDHLMAHELVADYRRIARPGDEVSFTSYCGGFPANPNPFCYKFSWSPSEMLRALRLPSRSLRNGVERIAQRPWQAIEPYQAPLPQPEQFEVYPNRDSVEFIGQYGFAPDWKIRDFVRGTIHLRGWADAWAGVFAEIEPLAGPAAEARLRELSERLRAENAYAEGEPDRVVLFVRLVARRDGQTVFDREWALDTRGNADGSAMAQLVSIPVALATEAVLAGGFAPGVHAAPDDMALVGAWLAEIGGIADYMEKLDHLKG